MRAGPPCRLSQAPRTPRTPRSLAHGSARPVPIAGVVHRANLKVSQGRGHADLAEDRLVSHFHYRLVVGALDAKQLGCHDRRVRRDFVFGPLDAKRGLRLGCHTRSGRRGLVRFTVCQGPFTVRHFARKFTNARDRGAPTRRGVLNRQDAEAHHGAAIAQVMLSLREFPNTSTDPRSLCPSLSRPSGPFLAAGMTTEARPKIKKSKNDAAGR
jgi:hypothetical protein